MAADDKTAKATTETAPVAFPMGLHEWCSELSGKDKRPEMIYAFSKDEAAKGHLSDLAANFQSRYEAFCGRPHS